MDKKTNMRNEDTSPLSAEALKALNQQAKESPRLRQHQNLHPTHKDPCQRLLNAIQTDSYIRPHRHLLDPKPETLIAVTGRFALLTFDDHGTLQLVEHFASEMHGGGKQCAVGVEIAPETWHCVIALCPDAILLEVKPGPFNPEAAKEWASWAPVEGSREAMEWLAAMKTKIQ